MTDFAIAQLSPMETKLVASLAAMTYESPYFTCAARHADRDGAFANCKKLGDYSVALLRHRANYITNL